MSSNNKVLLCQTFPLLAEESLARAGPRYRSPAQLCLPASVRLFIPGCTCVFVGMWRVAKLHRGLYECVCVCVCVCVRKFIFFAMCVCAFYNISNPPSPQTSTHHSPLPPHRHLPTREAFPEHTANKVGQVHGWALFLSESNFQEVPTGKLVPVPQTMKPWQGVSPSPLTSAELPLPMPCCCQEHRTATA